MVHADHVALLRHGIPASGGVWADLGAGSGAFTLALADLLGASATIYAVDRDAGALNSLRRAMQRHFPATELHTLVADFTQPLDTSPHSLPPLDGIVMANSLHYVRDKIPTLRRIRGLLKDTGRVLVVEYDTDRSNQWVPYPFTYPMWQQMARDAGFGQVARLATHPSSWLDQFYSAAAWE